MNAIQRFFFVITLWICDINVIFLLIKEKNMAKINVKQLPISERPYEKCLKYGASSLSDAELMAVIIKAGTKKENSIQLASKVLSRIPGGKISLPYSLWILTVLVKSKRYSFYVLRRLLSA